MTVFRLITPRQLADAIGVSESSLKRWADAGKIEVTRTDGGHRRIAITEAVRFIRETKSAVVRPDLLGLPIAETNADAQLTQLLMDGNAAAVHAAIVARFLSGQSIAAICDGPLRAALTHLGTLWRHTSDGVMVEHRATAICIDALGMLRSLVTPARDAPVAVGGAPSEDPYIVPSMMCGAALAEAGMRTVNLGAESPLLVLAQAADKEHANLIWLSVSTEPTERLRDEITQYLTQRNPEGAPVFIIGGRHREHFAQVPEVRLAGTIGELVAIAEDCCLRAPASQRSA